MPTKRKVGGDDKTWGAEVDVVIAGAGSAGLAAAVEAADAGAEVLVLEKQDRLADASTALSGGALAFAGTELQAKAGVRDSNELLYKDIIDAGQGKSAPELVKVYVASQLDTYRWLTNLGVEFSDLQALAGHSVPRAHHVDPLQLLYTLNGAATKRGVSVLFQAKVTGLVTDKNGRVIGVNAEERTGPVRVRARKGVILATGGFSRNHKMMDAIDPRYSRVAVINGKGHTGDGHRMAEELGAYLKEVKYVKPNLGLHVTGTSVVERLLIFYLGAIVVNKKGLRFVNESLSYKDLGLAALDQPDDVGFQLFDQKIYDQGLKNAKALGSTTEAAIGGMALNDERIKLLVKADTIEELAVQMGVPSAALRNTVDRYNRYVDAGRDVDFGRTALTKGWGKMVKIDTPPFYAFESRPSFVATYAGIAVNTDMQVLTAGGKIEGLYAVGEIIGGFHGANYVTGTSIGKSVIFGRVAGRNAANSSP